MVGQVVWIAATSAAPGRIPPPGRARPRRSPAAAPAARKRRRHRACTPVASVSISSLVHEGITSRCQVERHRGPLPPRVSGGAGTDGRANDCVTMIGRAITPTMGVGHPGSHRLDGPEKRHLICCGCPPVTAGASNGHDNKTCMIAAEAMVRMDRKVK